MYSPTYFYNDDFLEFSVNNSVYTVFLVLMFVVVSPFTFLTQHCNG
jgi:hypothetical protein